MNYDEEYKSDCCSENDNNNEKETLGKEFVVDENTRTLFGILKTKQPINIQSITPSITQLHNTTPIVTTPPSSSNLNTPSCDKKRKRHPKKKVKTSSIPKKKIKTKSYGKTVYHNDVKIQPYYLPQTIVNKISNEVIVPVAGSSVNVPSQKPLDFKYAYKYGILFGEDYLKSFTPKKGITLEGAFVFKIRSPSSMYFYSFGFSGFIILDREPISVKPSPLMIKTEEMALAIFMWQMDHTMSNNLRSSWYFIDAELSKAEIIQYPSQKDFLKTISRIRRWINLDKQAGFDRQRMIDKLEKHEEESEKRRKAMMGKQNLKECFQSPSDSLSHISPSPSSALSLSHISPSPSISPSTIQPGIKSNSKNLTPLISTPKSSSTQKLSKIRKLHARHQLNESKLKRQIMESKFEIAQQFGEENIGNTKLSSTTTTTTTTTNERYKQQQQHYQEIQNTKLSTNLPNFKIEEIKDSGWDSDILESGELDSSSSPLSPKRPTDITVVIQKNMDAGIDMSEGDDMYSSENEESEEEEEDDEKEEEEEISLMVDDCGKDIKKSHLRGSPEFDSSPSFSPSNS
jgi:hypothetical protein